MKKELDFETAAAQLSEILEQLSNEETPLAESLKLYARAAELIAFCNETLKSAQMTVEEIDAKLAQATQE